MDYKETVNAGYNAIANRYFSTRTRDSEDVRLLDELITCLPENAKGLDAGCGAGIPISQILSDKFELRHYPHSARGASAITLQLSQNA